MADLVETVARRILDYCNAKPDFNPVYDREAEDMARIAIAAVREAEGWRTDTESAPKDGTDVLLWMDGRPPVVAGLFGGEWRLWDTGEALRFPHGIEAWMPLPQPPESGE